MLLCVAVVVEPDIAVTLSRDGLCTEEIFRLDACSVEVDPDNRV